MPKTIPLTQAQRDAERWRRADRNFAAQIKAFYAVTGLNSSALAGMIGFSPATLNRIIGDPGRLKKSEERRLIGIFARYGMKYDPLLGERESA